MVNGSSLWIKIKDKDKVIYFDPGFMGSFQTYNLALSEFREPGDFYENLMVSVLEHLIAHYQLTEVEKFKFFEWIIGLGNLALCGRF